MKKCIYFINGNMDASLVGGAPISVENIVKNLKGYSYSIVASKNDKYKSKKLISFSEIGHLSFNPLQNFNFRLIMRSYINLILYLHYFFKTSYGISSIVKKNDILINNGHWCLSSDIIVVRFCLRSYISKLKKNKIFFNSILYFFDIKTKVILIIESLILNNNRVKRIVTLSSESKEDLVKYYPHLAHKITVIPNAVNIEKFMFSSNDRNHIRKKLNIPLKSKVILFAGNNIFRKNLTGVLEIYNQIAKFDIYLILLVKNELIQIPPKLNRRIKVINWTNGPEKYFSASDIFLFPTFYDTGAKVVLEALVSGLYCIVSKNTGVGEFLQKNSGRVINQDIFNTGPYIREIKKYINISKYQNRAIIKNKLYNWKDISGLYLKLINSI